MKYRQYFVLFGGFLVMLTFGDFYSIANLQHIIFEYMKNNTAEGKNFSLSSTTLIGGLLIFGQGAALSAGGFLEQKIGPQYTILFGGWFMSFNVALTFFTIQTNLAAVILTLGLLPGFGIGLAYGSVFAVPLSYFRKNTGLVIGIIASGYGFSSVIFDYLQKKITNNDKLKFPLSLCVIAAIYAIFQLIGSQILKDYSDKKEQAPGQEPQESLSNCEELTNPITQSSSLLDHGLDLEPHKLLQQFDFWIIWMIFLFNSYCIILFLLLVNTYAKVLGIDTKIHTVNTLDIYLLLIGIFQFLGRLFWGYYIDRKPFKTLMLIITILTSILMGTLNVIRIFEDVKLKFILHCLWISVLNFVFSGNLVIFPTICFKNFGRKYFVCNYGLIFTACSVSGTIVNVIISCSTFQNNNDQNYISKFYIYVYCTGALVSVLAVTLTWLFKGRSAIIYNY